MRRISTFGAILLPLVPLWTMPVTLPALAGIDATSTKASSPARASPNFVFGDFIRKSNPLSGTATPGCVGFAIVIETQAHPQSTKAHSQALAGTRGKSGCATKTTIAPDRGAES